MTTAFVLSGGGSLGAVQVGMLQALAARGVHPDLLIGTSAGALNAGYVAGHGTTHESLDELANVWGGLRRRDVFPLPPARLPAAAVGGTPSLCSSGPLRHLIAERLTFERLEDATIPLHVVATDVRTGEEGLLSEGDAGVALGADVLYVLPTGYACALGSAPSTPLSSAMHALTLLIEQRLVLEVAHF